MVGRPVALTAKDRSLRLAERSFYTTPLTPCPYLPGHLEQRLVTFLEPGDAGSLLNALNQIGFRRSQSMAYRPICPGCNACVPVRIPVDAFEPGRNLRKVLSRNEAIGWTERPKRITREQFELFHRYLNVRHPEGGMAEMTFGDYARMVEDDPSPGSLVEFREDGRLIAVSLTDRLNDGLSGVYKFYEPDLERRSLGTFVILWHVSRARQLGLPFVYLGYWIEGSPKMAYKARFRPLERLTRAGWVPFGDGKPAAR
ncbi:arginyltransferase [Marinivivus vitaminiproducens]|uniref:arginyltransferase n=1 Tax=Marinivivus vitaminiproducens TaxID=3035935 RepID=UPI00279FA547|nr:arginyltransferase [Geminicoccaceae bacterium SCSIO 64248]